MEVLKYSAHVGPTNYLLKQHQSNRYSMLSSLEIGFVPDSQVLSLRKVADNMFAKACECGAASVYQALNLYGDQNPAEFDNGPV